MNKLRTTLETLVRTGAFMGAVIASQADGKRDYAGDSLADLVYHNEQLPEIERAHDWYVANHKKDFDRYAAGRGMKSAPVAAVGSGDLPAGAVGGISVQGDHSILLGNRNFKQNVAYGLALPLNLTFEEGMRFYHDHEYAHSLGIRDELGVYTFQRDLYTHYARQAQGNERNTYVRMALAAEVRRKQYASNPSLQPPLGPTYRRSESLPYAA